MSDPRRRELIRRAVELVARSGIKINSRDPNEPKRAEKVRLEREIARLFQERFARQRERLKLSIWLRTGRKAVIDTSWITSALDDNDPEFIARLLAVLQQAAISGVELFGVDIPIGADWTLVNTEAAEWARRYAGELITAVDKTTLEAVQSAVSQFVETPGMTMGELENLLPFDPQRAQTIATTEVTSAYAHGQDLAGDRLGRDFPDLTIWDTWFTNNDDRVCPLCGPLNGKKVKHGEPFAVKANGDLVYAPPYHVNCRCWKSSNTDIRGKND